MGNVYKRRQKRLYILPPDFSCNYFQPVLQYKYLRQGATFIMKTATKRVLSFVLVLAMVFSLIATFSLTAGAATYSYNTGKRGTVCTALSTKAKAYYTGSYTYATLSKQSASTLKTNLKTLMTNTQTKVTSYNELRTLSAYSDSTSGSASKMTLLYSSDSISSAWDNGKSWNREHVWPQSLGTFTTSKCGSDLHHLHPCDSKVNSTRGNHPYGVVTTGSSYSTAKTAAGTVAGYYTSKYYEPVDSVKGDIARTLLYVYVRWGETNLTDVIQSTDVLLDWCAKDPVDMFEMGRNDVVQSIEGNRNVFIDYPEYAWLIFGKSVPSGIKTPSGNSGTSSGGSSGGSTGGSTTTKYTVSWGKSGTGSGTIKVTANGSTLTSGSKANSGSTIKVTLTPASGSTVTSLTVNGSKVTLSNNAYSFKLSKNTSMTVTWTKNTTTSTGTTYTKLTTTPSSWAGDYVIVGSVSGKYYALKATGTGTTLGSTSSAVQLSTAGITMSGSKLTNVPTNYVYTCKKSGSYYYFKQKNSNNYLAYKSSGLTTSTSYTGKTTLWSLSISSGNVTMKSTSNTSYRLCFNTSSKMFRCYSNNTYKLYFYKAG